MYSLNKTIRANDMAYVKQARQAELKQVTSQNLRSVMI
jgi:hypothetical protein